MFVSSQPHAEILLPIDAHRCLTRSSLAAMEHSGIAVRCSARLCQNPVFRAFWLYNSLILLGRIFKKSTFDTVWRFVMRGL